MGLLSVFKKKNEAPVEENPKEEPVKNEVPKTDKTAEKKDKPKVWHITKRAEDGRWQVKAEGASKATKLFRTKAEAEEYVKTLVANNEGSRAVPHKKDGTYQKK